jgi:subtilisin-like proprotein convertase family protein
VITYTGELWADNGLPYSGSVAVMARLYGQASGGTALWSADLGDVTVMNGVLQVDLSGAGLMAALAQADNLWLEFDIDSETLEPRQKLSSVPFARVAGDAQQLGGQPASAFVKTGDTLPGAALPTDGINVISNGSLKNEFDNVSWVWAGSANILDAEPANPPAATVQTVASNEGAGSYLTSVEIRTKFALNFSSAIEMVLTPPAASGLGAITLHNTSFIPGTYDETWTPANTPALAGLLGQQVAGTWTLTLRDLDNNAAGSPAIGVLQNFDVKYDVVRANHLQVQGRLDVNGDLNATGKATVGGELIRALQRRVFTHAHNYTGNSYVEVAGSAWNFTKSRTDTTLRIVWHDNIRCHTGSSWSGCQWRIRIDDKDCTTPGIMAHSIHSAPVDNNLHLPNTLVSYCSHVDGQPISAGPHELSVWVRTVNNADAWTGWSIALAVAGEGLTQASYSIEEIY